MSERAISNREEHGALKVNSNSIGPNPHYKGHYGTVCSSQFYKTFFGGNLENLDFPLRQNSKNVPF